MVPAGRVRPNVLFSLSDEANGKEIMSSVMGLGGDDYRSLEARLAAAEEHAIPLDLLPIMIDRGGNTIAMVLQPERLGEMVFLDHEVGEEGRATLAAAEADDWGYAIAFAPTFTAMIAGCRFEPLD